MVQARALLGQKAAHGRLRTERREQLYVVLARVEQHRLDPLLLDDLAVGDLELQTVAVELEAFLDPLHGDADVVDAVKHAPQFIRRGRPRLRSRPRPRAGPRRARARAAARPP